MSEERVRSLGGGPKSKLDSIEGIDEVFLEVLKQNTAGDPMKEDVKWTNLSRSQIITAMGKKGIKVSKNIVKKLLKKHKFIKRKIEKTQSTGTSKDRDEQFRHIAELRESYEAEGKPIISIDTKKKEFIGNLYRDGSVECLETIAVYDHDFPHLADGKIIPLSNTLYIELRVAHYPPYTSKWNPVEHRVFPHITRAMSGVVLKSIDLAKTLIEQTTTKSGLKVFAKISKKVADNFYEWANILFDEKPGHLNYSVNPFT